MKNFMFILTLFVVAVGCAPIQFHHKLSQPTHVNLIVCPGGEVVRINRTKDLPNIFGRADVWGGQVDAGYEVIRYIGLLPNGNFLFRVYSVDTHSDENTINRYAGGSIVKGPLGPRYLRYGRTTRILGRSQDIVVDKKHSGFEWRDWAIYTYPNKKSICVRYSIAE